MYRIARRGLAVLTTALVVASGAACSRGSSNSTSANVPGVTATEIVIGTHQPLTGPAAAGYSKISAASKAYFDYVNANGGVHGRKITYKVMDDGYNPANTQQVVRQLVLQDKVFAVFNGLGTPTHTGVLDFVNTNKVPDLFVASGSLSWNQPTKYPYTFGYNPDYTIEGKIIANYLKANFANQKVCFFGQHAAIGALKAAGCQVTVSFSVPGFTALALGTAARVGFKTQWVLSNVGADYTTLSGLLKAAGTPLLEGMLSTSYLPAVDDTANPWIALFRKLNEQYNNSAPFDGNVEYGFSVAYLFVQALKAAGKDLTRQGIVQAVEKGGFTGPGIAPFRYSKTDHSGYGGLQMAKVRGGKQLLFGPVYVTTDEATGAVQESSATQQAPPDKGIPT